MAEKPPYRIALEDVQEILIEPSDPASSAPCHARIIHGADASLIFADRAPGYHSKPHTHDAEQWNYILSGEIWFFVEKHGYRCRMGDVMRIPRNRTHWAWNRGTANAVVLEYHTPRLTADDQHLDRIAFVTGADEDTTNSPIVTSGYPAFNQAEIDAVEAHALAEEHERGA